MSLHMVVDLFIYNESVVNNQLCQDETGKNAYEHPCMRKWEERMKCYCSIQRLWCWPGCMNCGRN